jgi:hypothetical protein
MTPPCCKRQLVLRRVAKVGSLVGLGGVLAGAAEGALLGVLLPGGSDLALMVSVDRGLMFGLFGLVLGGLVGLADGLVRARHGALATTSRAPACQPPRLPQP